MMPARKIPKSRTITEKIEVFDKILPSGGFADTRIGTYRGQRRLVAVKTLRVAEEKTLDVKTVRVYDLLSAAWCAVLTILP